MEEYLKWLDQYPKSIHVSVILMIQNRYIFCLRMILRCYHVNLSELDTEELLHLINIRLNFSIHYCLECFVILICFVFLFHIWLISKSRLLTVFSKHFLSVMLDISRFLKIEMTSSTNMISCLLFCWIDNFEVLTTSSTMDIVMERGA